MCIRDRAPPPSTTIAENLKTSPRPARQAIREVDSNIQHYQALPTEPPKAQLLATRFSGPMAAMLANINNQIINDPPAPVLVQPPNNGEEEEDPNEPWQPSGITITSDEGSLHPVDPGKEVKTVEIELSGLKNASLDLQLQILYHFLHIPYGWSRFSEQRFSVEAGEEIGNVNEDPLMTVHSMQDNALVLDLRDYRIDPSFFAPKETPVTSFFLRVRPEKLFANPIYGVIEYVIMRELHMPPLLETPQPETAILGYIEGQIVCWFSR
eukprot:TRINITY_DN9122_c0_g1_i3.p1 TRINITY_DN9122_c0_g1~~TRINITY_DN9122_c0_g1_i3.p1  ORF type:complete len:286 (-),score=38.72 TRINITY_DN9122_c0_g1_i3:184-984(-)